ncbi:MAG TPA: phage antirepressor N-terminal domain-containing protein [Vineibacter sp.]|nr:phage antirepressor N-terminal domain-containing protein [Vineibacter sp.]
MQVYEINFLGVTFLAVKTGIDIDVPIRPVCDVFGINRIGQQERIRRDPVLNEGSRIRLLPSPGGPQEMLCLSLDVFHLWAATLTPSRVQNEDAHPLLNNLRKQAGYALRDYFVHGIAINADFTATLVQADLFGDEGYCPAVRQTDGVALTLPDDRPATNADIDRLYSRLADLYGQKLDGIRAAFLMMRQTLESTGVRDEQILRTLDAVATKLDDMGQYVYRLVRPMLIGPRVPFTAPPNPDWKPKPKH